MVNGEKIDLKNVVLSIGGKEIGTLETMSTSISLDATNVDRHEINPTRFSDGFSGNLKITNIDYDNELLRPVKLCNDIWFYTDVVRYTKHSKKRSIAIKKLKKIIDEYKQHI